MLQLPNELLHLVSESLSGGHLARLSRVSHVFRDVFEPDLYRLHAFSCNRWSPVAVMWAMKEKNVGKAGIRAALLEKVARFCNVGPAVLDEQYMFSYPGCYYGLYQALSTLGVAGSWNWHTNRQTPLHVAAFKGLDDVVVWLLDHGADTEVLLKLEPKITPLYLAVLNNCVSTAVLLLTRGANPYIPTAGKDKSTEDTGNSDGADDRLTVAHLACFLGHADLAEQLLATERMTADPSQLLSLFLDHCKEDRPEMVAFLLRRGAKASDAVLRALLHGAKWRSARELLQLPAYGDRMTARRASSILKNSFLPGVCQLEDDVAPAEKVLRRLLDRGADPNLGRLLWLQLPRLRLPTLLGLLPPLLEAKMDVRPAKEKYARWDEQVAPRSAAHGVSSILGDISAYDKDLNAKEVAAQLEIVRLLLQGGAPICGPTRGSALDMYPRYPGKYSGRARWAYELSQVVLEHCHSMSEDQRGDDINIFLSRFAEKESYRLREQLPGL